MHYAVGWLKSRVLLAYADEADIRDRLGHEAEIDTGVQEGPGAERDLEHVFFHSPEFDAFLMEVQSIVPIYKHEY